VSSHTVNPGAFDAQTKKRHSIDGTGNAEILIHDGLPRLLHHKSG
jgi:hypothetical protein